MPQLNPDDAHLLCGCDVTGHLPAAPWLHPPPKPRPPSLVPLSPHIHTHTPPAHAHTQTPSMCTAHAHRLNQCARTHTRTPHPHMPTHVHRACVHTHTHADTHAHTRTSTRMKPSPHRRDPGAEHTESPVGTGTDVMVRRTGSQPCHHQLGHRGKALPLCPGVPACAMTSLAARAPTTS